MSFGYAVGDAVLLTQLAWRIVQNARRACGEHDELTQEVSGLHVVILRLEQESRQPSCPINRSSETYAEELGNLVNGCEKNLNILDQVLTKYNALNEQERSGRRLWQKIRFGNGKMADLADLRARLTYYTSAMSLFLNMVSMGTMGRVEQQLNDAGGDLKEIKIAVNEITAKMMSKSKLQEGTILTAYGDDDTAVWKEFRRELVQDGFSSSIIREHKKLIRDYIEELGSRGVLDEVGPSADVEEEYRNGDWVIECAMTSDVETKVFSNASLKPRAEVQSSMKSEAQLDSETNPHAAVHSHTESEDKEVPIEDPVSKVDSRTKPNAESPYIRLSDGCNGTDPHFPVEENRMLKSENGSSTSIRDGHDKKSNDAGKRLEDVFASCLKEESSASNVDDSHYANEEELPKRTARDTRKEYFVEPFSARRFRDMDTWPKLKEAIALGYVIRLKKTRVNFILESIDYEWKYMEILAHEHSIRFTKVFDQLVFDTIEDEEEYVEALARERITRFGNLIGDSEGRKTRICEIIQEHIKDKDGILKYREALARKYIISRKRKLHAIRQTEL